MSQVGQERLGLLALDAERVIRAGTDLLLCQLVDKSTVKLLAFAGNGGERVAGLTG